MIHFDLLLPEGGMPGAIWAAVDVLRELNRLARIRAPGDPHPAASWRVVHGTGRTHPSHSLTCQTDSERLYARRASAAVRVVLMPPFGATTVPPLRRLVKRNADAVRLVRDAVDAGALIGTCGTGIWLLAETDRLERAPTQWMYQAPFARFHPRVSFDPMHPIVEEKRIVCAATPSLIHALVLRLVGLAGLSDLAHTAAEHLLLNTERQQISAAMQPQELMVRTRDAPLYRAMAWIRKNVGKPISLPDVAKAAAVSERTLRRQFAQHLDKTPLQYIHELRVSRAKMWLESTWRSVDEIAHDCCYDDTSAFCRMFARATGTSPNRYRERFSGRGPRALWKVQDEG